MLVEPFRSSVRGVVFLEAELVFKPIRHSISVSISNLGHFARGSLILRPTTHIGLGIYYSPCAVGSRAGLDFIHYTGIDSIPLEACTYVCEHGFVCIGRILLVYLAPVIGYIEG